MSQLWLTDNSDNGGILQLRQDRRIDGAIVRSRSKEAKSPELTPKYNFAEGEESENGKKNSPMHPQYVKAATLKAS